MEPEVNTEEEQTNAEGPGPDTDPGPDRGPLVLKLRTKVGSIVAGGDGKPEVSGGGAVTSSATKGGSSGFQSIPVSATKRGSTMEGSTGTLPLPLPVTVEVPCVSSSGGTATSASISSTINQSIQPMPIPMPTLRFVLRRPASPTSDPNTPKRVRFHESVVDNEKMNRRKSKCCCIYRKPHPFGESSSETDDECEHCFGHPEVRAKNRLKKSCGCGCCGGHSHSHTDVVPEEEPNAQPVVQVVQVVPVVSEGSGDQQQEAAPEDSSKTKTAAQKTDDDQDDVPQSCQSS